MTVTDVTPLAVQRTTAQKHNSTTQNNNSTCPYCATSPAADLLAALQSSADATKAIRQLHAALTETTLQRASIDPADTLQRASNDLLRQSRSLQLQLRALESDIRRGVGLLQASQQAHPRCAVCTRVAGVGHEVAALRREPNGSASVCDECWRDLTARGLTAARLVRQWIEDEQRERRE